MPKNYSLFICLFFVGLFFSCKNDPIASRTAFELIPESAYSVTEIRIGQILEKADFENFQKTAIYQEFIEDVQKDSKYMAEVLKDMDKSGVDLDQSIYSFSAVPSKNLTRTVNAFIIPLKDNALFSKIMTNANGGRESVNQNGISFYSNMGSIVAWSEEFAVLGMGSRKTDMLEMAESVLNKSHSKSLADNKSLRKTLSKNHDINIWTCSNPYAKNGDAQMGAAFLGFDPDALMENYIYGFVDFEDGKITSTSEFDLQKDLTDDFDLFFKDEVKTDFNKFIPEKDLTMAFSVALDVKGINQVLNERPQTKKIVDYSMESYGMTMSDIAKIFPGDLALALYNMGDGDEDAYGIFMMEIGDREGLDKILNLGVEYEMIQKLGDDRYLMDKEMSDGFYKSLKRNTKYEQPELRIAHNKLIITANAEVLDGFTKGRLGLLSGLSKGNNSLLKNHIFGGLVNLDEIQWKEWEGKVPFGQLNLTTNRKKADFNLNFENKNQNSLKSLLDFVNDIYLKDKQGNSI